MCSYIGLFIAMDDTKSHYSDKCHRNIPLNALKTLSTKLHHLPKLFIFMYNKFVAIASVLGVFQFIRGPKSVQFCFFLPWGGESNEKKRGTCFEHRSSASDLPTVPVWKMGLPQDPLLGREIKWGAGLRVGSALEAYSSPVALRCCLFQNIFFSKEWEKKPQTKQTYILKYNLWKRRL